MFPRGRETPCNTQLTPTIITLAAAAYIKRIPTTMFKISGPHSSPQVHTETSLGGKRMRWKRARVLIVIGCYWVSLPASFHSHSFSLLLPARLILLTLTVSCNSGKSPSAPQDHFMHFLLQLCRGGVFKWWFTSVTETQTHKHAHSLISWGWVSRPNIIIRVW